MANWENIEDPAGRLKPGMTVRFRTNPNRPRNWMKVLALHAPTALWVKPLEPGVDDPALVEIAELLERTEVPCSKDHPKARYREEALMVEYRWIEGGGRTTCKAMDVVAVEDEVLDLYGAER